MTRSTRGALLCVLGMAALAAGCEGRPRRAGQDATASATPVALDAPAVAEIDLTRGAPELVPATLLGPTRQRTHVDLVRSLRALRESDATKGVLVRLGAARVGFARAHEIGRLLGELRAAGTPVVCH